MRHKICIVFGTRPEIIKMAPVIYECRKRRVPFFILHTGQHYSYRMDKIFLRELGIPRLDYHLGIGSSTPSLHGAQTAKMLAGIEEVLIEEQPSVVLVEGDTNSVLAAALAAAKLHIPLGHVEAGLRSYDRRMPEEVNRVLTDHLSDFLFAPTKEAAANARKEGIPAARIFVTGNTIVDATLRFAGEAETHAKILSRLRLAPRKYLLATLHRQENVDVRARFADVLRGFEQVARATNLPILWPLHPRAKGMLEKFHLSDSLQKITQIRLIEPVGFFDFLLLEQNARLVLTDSGGVQEESCILGVPCVTLRENTERPETIAVGANMLAGTDPARIASAASRMLEKKRAWRNPFGDGHAARRIVDALVQKLA